MDETAAEEETPQQKALAIAGWSGVIAAALGIAYWIGAPARKERQALKERGAVATARLTKDADILCRHGRRSVKYEFDVDGKTFGRTESVGCDVEIAAEPEVVYLPSDPTVSRLLADNRDIRPKP